MQNTGHVISTYGVDKNGLSPSGTVHWNLGSAALAEKAIAREEGQFSKDGALVCLTGQHTGRSPNDKFIVKEPTSQDHIWWGKVNKPFEVEQFDALYGRILAYLQNKNLYVQDCCAGADKEKQLHLRVITETAWHNLFARNMFIQINDLNKIANHVPAFTILHVPNFQAVPAIDGTNSEVFVVVDYSKQMVLIGGTNYAGEIKKSVFSVPDRWT